ncbi:MAG: hypothetical protein ACYCVH_11050 [Ignavibacteriaceae bacterium]
MKYLYAFTLIFLMSIHSYSQPIGTKPAPGKGPLPLPPLHNTKVVIKSPKDGSKFAGTFEIRGIAKNIPLNQHLWLVTNPRPGNYWYPQWQEIVPDANGNWDGTITIGGDPCTLHDVHLVFADSEANRIFDNYIATQVKEHYPYLSKPNGAVSKTKITVTKLPLYGYTKFGTFFVHKSLIPLKFEGDSVYFRFRYNGWKDLPMTFDGEYYYCQSGKSQLSGALEYCFHCGSRSDSFIPEYWIENQTNKDDPKYYWFEYQGSSLNIKKEDTYDNGQGGSNFRTRAVDCFPDFQK